MLARGLCAYAGATSEIPWARLMGRNWFPAMKTFFISHLLRLLAVITLVGAFSVRPVAGQTVVLSANPVTAWADLERGYGAMRPPTSWQGKTPRPGEVTGFQKIIRTSSTTSKPSAAHDCRADGERDELCRRISSMPRSSHHCSAAVISARSTPRFRSAGMT